MGLTSGSRLKREWAGSGTDWGTIMFVDTDRGALRHGPDGLGPANLVLGESNGTAYLFHIAPDGTRFTVRMTPSQQGSREAMSSNETTTTRRFQTFRILPTTSDDLAAFGLESEGLLLCAEGEGRVSLSRSALGPWERFRLAEPS